MKTKTIKAIIKKKIDGWLASIEDEVVRDLAAKNAIVTGGCIASMLLNEKVNDFDLYFKTREAALAVAEYYVARFKPSKRKGVECQIWVDEARDDRVGIVIKSAGIASEDGTEKSYEYFESRPEGEGEEYVSALMDDAANEIPVDELAIAAADEGKPKFRPVFMSTNAITLSHKIQIVLRFYGDPGAIHENYDFVHCTNYWKSWDHELELRKAALEALLTKELRYIGSKFPICSMIRTRKFIQRGWSINAGQMLKMAMQIGELDLKNPAVLQDQLTGVDVAYFAEVIAKVKERDPAKINAAYLIEIIDRMF